MTANERTLTSPRTRVRAPRGTGAEGYALAEWRAYRLLRKVHQETNCGRPTDDDHWMECDNLVEAFGWVSWEAWHRSVTGGE